MLSQTDKHTHLTIESKIMQHIRKVIDKDENYVGDFIFGRGFYPLKTQAKYKPQKRVPAGCKLVHEKTLRYSILDNKHQNYQITN